MYPRTVSELYPSNWLGTSDLNGRTFTLTIKSCTIDSFYNARKQEEEPKAVLAFNNAQKRMILNKTQTQAVADIAGTEVFAEWQDLSITLFPSMAVNGKPTIGIRPSEAPKPAPPAPAPPAQETTAMDENADS